MAQAHGFPADGVQLAGVVRDVRARWRLKHALRGATVAVVLAYVVLAAAAWTAHATHAAEAPLNVIRAAMVAIISVLFYWFVARPLRAGARDEQVALYVEERERSLDGALVTALEVNAGSSAALRSPALAERLVRSAVDGMRRIDGGDRVDGGEIRRSSLILASVIAGAVLVSLAGPVALRQGLGALLMPRNAVTFGELYTISVEPGNTTIARNGDQLISATLHGFDAERVELLVRAADSTRWTRVTMAPDSTGRRAFRLFDIATKTDYAVEAGGVRSPTFRLDVADLPYVKRLDLEYRFPAYTQLPVQRVDSTGDIAALTGTMVRIRVLPTTATPGGRVIVDGGDTLSLAPTADGALIAMLRVKQSGFYKIELQGPDGRMLTGSLDYTIDALPDRPPVVNFVKPGRDTRALAVDEVYSEVRATDDYGLANVEIVYSVNGAPEQSIPLSPSTARVLRDLSAGHTFMLEEQKLQPGDVVSYYARATDNDAVSGAKTSSTDIYFIQIRPYAQDYRQQQQGEAPGGAPGQQDNPGQLSQQQREIISATFNAGRDSATASRKTFEENLATLRLSQQRLREQVNQLASRLVQRGIAARDSGFRKIAEILPLAAAAMDSAERQLVGSAPRGALPPEQRALQQLQRAEAVFREIQVRSQGAGAGGGGGGQQSAQDLADIFELQKDKLRNQYEQVQRGQEQGAPQNSAKVDELLERLKQLAARQQQEDERARRKADSLSRMGATGATGASGGSGQRQLAQEAEQQARQLERLARERQSPALTDAARRLQEASDAMRRAAANGQNGSGAARSAQEKLADARRLLDQEKASGAQRDVADAQQSAQRLAEQERQIAEDMKKLGEQSAGTPALQRSLSERKAAMADSLRSLTNRLEKSALENGRAQPGAARALGEAADTLRGRRIEDRVRASQQQLRTGAQDYLNALEKSIGDGIGDLEQRLARAKTAASEQSPRQAQAQALDKMRDLVRGMQSMNERAQQQGQGSSGNRQNQNGSGGINPSSANAPQLAREMQQRVADAQSLRNELTGQGVDVAALDRAIETMRSQTTAQSLADTRAAKALREQVIDGLKAYEFSLRKAGAADDARVVSGRAGEVPPAFRAYVEEYYRAIAKPPKP